MALSAQEASMASCRPVNTCCLLVSVFRVMLFQPDKSHSLPHGTYIEILPVIVEKIGYAERIVAVSASLLDMEHVVLDIRQYPVTPHVLVILLRSIAAVRHYFQTLHAVACLEGLQVVDQRERVTRTLVNPEVGYKLVFRGYLHVVTGFELSVEHGILLHAHERRVIVCLGVGVALFHDGKLPAVFLHFRQGFALYLLDCLGLLPCQGCRVNFFFYPIQSLGDLFYREFLRDWTLVALDGMVPLNLGE